MAQPNPFQLRSSTNNVKAGGGGFGPGPPKRDIRANCLSFIYLRNKRLQNTYAHTHICISEHQNEFALREEL